jgi:hypothetical protein
MSTEWQCVCEPHLFYMDSNAAVLFLVVMTLTHAFAWRCLNRASVLFIFYKRVFLLCDLVLSKMEPVF